MQNLKSICNNSVKFIILLCQEMSQKKQEQWEGFQQFCQSNTSRVNQIAKENQESGQMNRLQSAITHQQNQQNETEELKPRTSPYKKMKIKVKLGETVPKKQQDIQNTVHQETKKITDSNEPQSQTKHSIRSLKYERIPIMKKDDDYRYAGNVVYRSFAPRSSDTYFRTLKQVNFTTISEKKTKSNQPYQFNSRIESGNLGSVFQGWRI